MKPLGVAGYIGLDSASRDSEFPGRKTDLKVFDQEVRVFESVGLSSPDVDGVSPGGWMNLGGCEEAYGRMIVGAGDGGRLVVSRCARVDGGCTTNRSGADERADTGYTEDSNSRFRGERSLDA